MLYTDYKYCDMFSVGVRDILKSWVELLITQREFGTEVSIKGLCQEFVTRGL